MILVKIGGGDSINLEGIIRDLARFEEPFLIIHGANALRDELGRKMGYEKKILTSQSGYSSVYSDKQALDLMMMSYAGLRNKRLVELCQQNGINAVGLSGLDGRLVTARRNRGIRVREGKKIRIVRDLSGKPRFVNTFLIRLLMDNGFVPVISVPILDENGVAVNSENDDILYLLQKSLKADTVISFIEAPGFLENPEDDASVVPELSRHELGAREEAAEGRMKRKMRALRKIATEGAARLILSDGRIDAPLFAALAGQGTVIS